ncbi:c0c6fa77-1674-4e21-ad51-cc9ca7bd4fa9-CDS [Sclerotinia trifoliorum]|uniref:C0c6fa77-1674-4e21-ad51-cc9ca7bd4fa9-CDS n=1 Tax=Sclerotinia trifoliorum TaxID=28548 RepID=A0A8H2VZW1_9HELO|nr:c0c6fa77-1674-4e21-ad51-cc9ca7bd4fa9-CDS [Sclerotinia trifoliorum]
MRSLIVPRSLMRSCRTTSRQPIGVRHTAIVCQICHQQTKPLFQSPTISSRRNASSSTNPSSSTSPDQTTASVTSPPRTHYDLFPITLPRGPPPSGPFHIDVRALRNEFLRLQASAHPDLHSSSNKSRAEAKSALINEAYRTLQSPLLRAQYLLGLQGIDVHDETGKTGAEDGDKELLMEVLETREEIEEAEEEGDLDGLKVKNEERIANCEDAVGKALEAGDLETAMRETVRLRYWVNVRDSLHAWEKGKPVVMVH